MISRLHKKRVPYVEQMQQTECGLCCATMLLRYYRGKDRITTIREYLEAGRDGLKLSFIAQYLKSRGMETTIYKAGIDSLSQLPLPAVIFWNNEHFVVLESIKKDSYIIVDPAFGRRKIDRETMEQSYSDIIMIVSPTKEYKASKEKSDTWGIVFDYIKKRKATMIIVVLMSLVAYALQLSVPVMTENIIDSDKINNYGLMVLGLSVLLGLINFLRGRKMIVMH